MLVVIMTLQMCHLGSNIGEGDVILTNHPAAGGSHLPDLTVITPVSVVVLHVNPSAHAAVLGVCVSVCLSVCLFLKSPSLLTITRN